MYALMITFESDIELDALRQPFADYAGALGSVPGLNSKAWIRDGSTLGGFHLFADRSAADLYLTSDMVAGLQATDGFHDFEVRGFEVLDDLSAKTGISVSAGVDR